MGSDFEVLLQTRLHRVLHVLRLIDHARELGAQRVEVQVRVGAQVLDVPRQAVAARAAVVRNGEVEAALGRAGAAQLVVKLPEPVPAAVVAVVAGALVRARPLREVPVRRPAQRQVRRRKLHQTAGAPRGTPSRERPAAAPACCAACGADAGQSHAHRQPAATLARPPVVAGPSTERHGWLNLVEAARPWREDRDLPPTSLGSPN